MQELARVNEARQALAEAETPEEARDVEDKASLLAKALAKHDGNLERANEFAELAVEAACKVGALLPDGRMGRPPKGEKSLPPGEDFSPPVSSRYRQLGASDPAARLEYYQEARDSGDTINKTALLRSLKGLAANYSSDSNEWYTPARYVDAVRELYGGAIDLDPASCAKANETVQAAQIFTLGDDALSQDWHGRAFLNPPYGTDGGESVAGKFCRKAVAEHMAGRLEACVILVNSSHSQKWQAPLYEWPVCFVDHRICFENDRGQANENPTFQNIFVCVGGNVFGEFARIFSRFGYVMVPDTSDLA